jgi:hypothetical protein
MELPSLPLDRAELLHLDDALWVLTAPAAVPNYDFDFATFFRCRRPWQPPEDIAVVARIGAIPHYDLVFDALRREA